VAVYGEDLQDIPQDLPVFTEKKKKQQILESYAFNKVPENIAKPEQQIRTSATTRAAPHFQL